MSSVIADEFSLTRVHVNSVYCIAYIDIGQCVQVYRSIHNKSIRLISIFLLPFSHYKREQNHVKYCLAGIIGGSIVDLNYYAQIRGKAILRLFFEIHFKLIDEIVVKIHCTSFMEKTLENCKPKWHFGYLCTNIDLVNLFSCIVDNVWQTILYLFFLFTHKIT